MKKFFSFCRRYYLFSLAAAVLVLSLVALVSGYGTLAKWLLGVTASVEVIPLLVGMYNDLRTGRYGIDILAAAAITASVVMGQYWAGIVIVLMLTGGEALEDYAESRAKVELSALLNKAPKLAHAGYYGNGSSKNQRTGTGYYQHF